MTAEYIKLLVEQYFEIREICLIGSRADGSERPDSDWDYIVFGNLRVINSSRQKSCLHAKNIDLIIVYDGNQFREPWRDDDCVKSGPLPGWNWKVTDDGAAVYRANKWVSDHDVELNSKIGIAKRIWKRS